MEELLELAYTNLRLPKGLINFIWEHTDFQTNRSLRSARYVEVIELWRGKLIQRVFAFVTSDKKCRKKDMIIEEVARVLEGHNGKQLIKNVYNTMYGKHVNFGGSDERFYLYESRWSFNAYRMTDEQELIDRLDLKYCQWETAKGKVGLSFFDYICAYREQPKIELLVKAGLYQYVHCYKKLNMKAKSLDKILRVNNYWMPYLSELEYGDVMIIKNKNHHIQTIDELNRFKKTMEKVSNDNYKVKKYLQPKNLKFVSEMTYSEKKFYNDYLDFCERLGYDLTDKSILCPRELKSEHDKLMNLNNVKKSEATKRKIHEAYIDLLPYVYSKGKYVILPCESVEDLENESRKLHHCVKTYADRYANKKTNIMFIREVNNVTEPLVTLEFCGKKVIQARAHHNGVPCDSINDFIRHWAKRYDLLYEV